MKMHRGMATTVLGSVATLAIACAAFAETAFAGPEWKFDGSLLGGVERIQGGSTDSAFTLPGVTVSCKGLLYSMDAKNSGGIGQAEIDYLPIFKCSTDTLCEVAVTTVYDLPWLVNLTQVSLTNYVVLKGVKIGFLFKGELCVLDEVEAVVTGTAGGSYDNVTETITFSKSTFTATGTKLSAFGTKVEWNASFDAAAFGPHLGEALTIS